MIVFLCFYGCRFKLTRSTMFNYTEEDMQKALAALKDGMKLREAARTFSVPKTTLLYKHTGKYPVKRRMGPETILSRTEEKLLVDWIIHMGKHGFPITKCQLLDSVQKLLNDMNRTTVFKNNRPGRTWYNRFKKRNPEISERVYQNLTRARSSVTETQIRNWFDEVESYLEKNEYSDILNDPTRVFNMDETAFFLTPTGGRVLAKKGSKTVYSFVQNDDKECLTSLIGSSADGILIPPMVVFPYVRIPERLGTSVPSGWGIGKSESGWMTGELFFEYMANIFRPWLSENKIKLPVIVFIDGHTSHLTYALSDFCSKNGIILVALFPNATHIIQPMDVGLFHVLKDHWRDRINLFRMKENGRKIKREEFCGLLKDILDTINTKTTILRSAFRACGLYPFNADLINFGKKIKGKNTTPSSTEISPSNVAECNTVQANEQPDCLQHLLLFEKFIEKEKLKEFKSSGNVWNGGLEDKGLFDVWIQMKNKIDQVVTVVAVCTTNNEIIVSDEAVHEILYNEQLEEFLATEQIEEIIEDFEAQELAGEMDDMCKIFFLQILF